MKGRVEIYAPEEWSKFFGTPNLIYEDDKLYTPREADSFVLREPLGYVDKDGYVYRSSPGLFSEPIGRMVREGGKYALYGSNYNDGDAKPVGYFDAPVDVPSKPEKKDGEGGLGPGLGAGIGTAALLALAGVLLFFGLNSGALEGNIVAACYASAGVGTLLSFFIGKGEFIAHWLSAEIVTSVLFWAAASYIDLREEGYSLWWLLTGGILGACIAPIICAVPATVGGTLAWALRKLTGGKKS